MSWDELVQIFDNDCQTGGTSSFYNTAAKMAAQVIERTNMEIPMLGKALDLEEGDGLLPVEEAFAGWPGKDA